MPHVLENGDQHLLESGDTWILEGEPYGSIQLLAHEGSIVSRLPGMHLDDNPFSAVRPYLDIPTPIGPGATLFSFGGDLYYDVFYPIQMQYTFPWSFANNLAGTEGISEEQFLELGLSVTYGDPLGMLTVTEGGIWLVTMNSRVFNTDPTALISMMIAMPVNGIGEHIVVTHQQLYAFVGDCSVQDPQTNSVIVDFTSTFAMELGQVGTQLIPAMDIFYPTDPAFGSVGYTYLTILRLGDYV